MNAPEPSNDDEGEEELENTDQDADLSISSMLLGCGKEGSEAWKEDVKNEAGHSKSH